MYQNPPNITFFLLLSSEPPKRQIQGSDSGSNISLVKMAGGCGLDVGLPSA